MPDSSPHGVGDEALRADELMRQIQEAHALTNAAKDYAFDEARGIAGFWTRHRLMKAQNALIKCITGKGGIRG